MTSRPLCLLTAAALTSAVSVRADMCVARWSAGPGGPHPAAVKIVDAGEGRLIRIDLKELPTEARVHRARLYLAPVNTDLPDPAPTVKGDLDFGGAGVYAVKASAQEGQAPQLEADPLPAAAPGFDCLDATDIVRRWLGGKTPNRGLYARNAAALEKDKVCLEIAYEGKADSLPAQVQGVSVLHRAGQSFITWKDPEDAFGDKPVTWGQLRDYLRDTDPKKEVRYRVYRHTKPIDARTIAEAALVAEVKPLSGFNINGWSLERLINQVIFSNDDRGEMGMYGYFEGWNMGSDQGRKLVIRRLAVEDDKPLPSGMGLFVFSTPVAETVYYAVTAMADGRENCADFSANVSRAVEEKPAPWQPVRQPSDGKDFGFDFRGQRQFHVQWAAPPLAPRQGMYFNWSVLLPGAALEKDFPKDQRLPVELFFHAPGYSYARPPVKFLENSIQIAPHDFPFSGWYGYNDAAGTLKDCRQGAVSPHTQKRIAAFMEWARTRFPIDPARVVGVGGDGAGLTALYQPEMFAYMLITGFESDVLDTKTPAKYAAAWGPKSPEIKNDKGLGEWNWAMLDVLLTGVPMPRILPKDQIPPPPADPTAPGWKAELPFFVVRGVTWGHDPGYVHGRGKFLYALQSTGHGEYARWAWGGSLKAPAKYTGLWQGLDLTSATPFPAIAYSTADQEGEGQGNCNGGYTWPPIKDEADGVEITIAGRESTFDLTPRRLRKFKIAPGDKIAYEIKSMAGPRSGGTGAAPPAAAQTGQIVADINGVATLKGVQIGKGAAAVTVKLSKVSGNPSEAVR